MVENRSGQDNGAWKKFFMRHWRAATLTSVGIGLAVVGAVLVYVWYVGQAQSTGLVPSTLGLWTMTDLVAFLLNLAFWELIVIGIPVVIGAAVVYTWYKRLPAEERDEYRRAKLFKSGSRRSDAGNWFSFLFFIAFAIKIYLDGKWDVAFSTWDFDYLVYSGLLAVIAVLLIIGIPALVGGLWWLNREMKRGA